MSIETIGHGMTAEDVMLQRTRYLYRGGEVPPGLEESAAIVRANRRKSLFARFLELFGF